MLGKYEVLTGALKEAAAAARSAGEAAEVLDAADVLCEGIARALPGSKSADCADDLAEFWRNFVKSWGAAVSDYSEKLVDSADCYEQQEEEVQRSFLRLEWGTDE
ncbi:hypothetical protein ADK67_16735 [Saccharothrix sp. NRRL B-16348]|uniref:hypothetical protein n=1 Tax=Saccharothrix sp. NRRL B-16348 TaxID=1415542 RepID=UPI0006AFF231|nr:hypothetical protein [Saccharothrix sp. NRRL B-16348]KOX25516.1 hypothetical protein ADK67_16735 [Saccharothrix sp. NRRL B-16348]